MSTCPGFFVPIEGYFEVNHSIAEFTVDQIKNRLERYGQGPLISLGVVVDGKPGGAVHFIHDDTLPVNPRAREALALLTGVHIVLTGAVMFTGIEERTVDKTIAALSGGTSRLAFPNVSSRKP